MPGLPENAIEDILLWEQEIGSTKESSLSPLLERRSSALKDSIDRAEALDMARSVSLLHRELGRLCIYEGTQTLHSLPLAEGRVDMAVMPIYGKNSAASLRVVVNRITANASRFDVDDLESFDYIVNRRQIGHRYGTMLAPRRHTGRSAISGLPDPCMPPVFAGNASTDSSIVLRESSGYTLPQLFMPNRSTLLQEWQFYRGAVDELTGFLHMFSPEVTQTFISQSGKAR